MILTPDNFLRAATLEMSEKHEDLLYSLYPSKQQTLKKICDFIL